MTDFLAQFQAIEDFLRAAAEDIFSKLDRFTFKMLVNCLKSSDYYVVSEAIDQLVKEKRLLAIPPLFFVCQAHPNSNVREKAALALKTLDTQGEVAKLTQDKSIEDAVRVLIASYGNYRN